MKQFVVSLLCLTVAVGMVVGQTCPINEECYFRNVSSITPTQSNPNMYVVIGGLFDIHLRGEDALSCSSEMSEEGMVNLLAFFYAINKYQVDLGPVSVGAVAFDNCMRPEQTIENMLGYAQSKINIKTMDSVNLVAYVGPYSDIDVKKTAHLATDIGVTLVSPGATSLDLDVEGTSLLRTSPSMSHDLNAISAFLTHSNVNAGFAIILYDGSDSYWLATATELKEVLESSVCVTLFADINQYSNMKDLVNGDLKDAVDQKYVIPLMGRDKLELLFTEIHSGFKDNSNTIVYGDIRFILTSETGRDLVFMAQFADTVKDAIVVSQDEEDIPLDSADLDGFYNYMNGQANEAINNLDNIWLRDYKAMYTLPTFDKNTPSNLKDAASRTMFSVKVIMEGIETALQDCSSNSNPTNYQFCDEYRNQKFRDNKLHQAIRDSSNLFDANSGQLKDSSVRYTYYHLENPEAANMRYEAIGNFQNGDVESLPRLTDQSEYGDAFTRPTCSGIEQCCRVVATTPTPTDAPGQTSDDPQPNTTPFEPPYSLVRYKPDEYITGAYPYHTEDRGEWSTRFSDDDHKWVIALGVLAGMGILCVIVFEIYILYKLIGTSMARQWRTMLLGQLLLFGIFCSYLVLFAYLFTPTKETCGITRFGVGTCYAICFAVLLVKLMVLLTSKTSDALLPGDESVSYLKGTYQFLMFIFAVGVQVVIDAQWLILVPPDAVEVTANNGKRVWICNHYTWEASKGNQDMSEFVRTNFENHVLSLVYIMVMILITTILSLNAHGIITNHRESVFIGIAAGFSIPIWLAWTLVGGLNYEDDFAQEFGDACIAFGLFSTATLILFAMFLPKVRQLVNMGEEGIYVEDDRDTYYAGSVIMAPPSYKKGPPSVIYVNHHQGIYSEPVVVNNGENLSKEVATHLKHPGSTYSAPPAFVKRPESAHGSRILRVTDDLKGRHPQSTKRPQSEVAYGSAGRPRSQKGTLSGSRSSNLGAL